MCEICCGNLPFSGVILTLPEGKLTEKGLQRIINLAKGLNNRSAQILDVPEGIRGTLKVTVCARKTFAIGPDAREKYLGGLGLPVNPEGREVEIKFKRGGELKVKISGAEIRRGNYIKLLTEPVDVEIGNEVGTVGELLHFLPTSLGGDPVMDQMQDWNCNIFRDPERVSYSSRNVETITWL